MRLKLIGNLATKDPYTAHHSVRVAHHALELGRVLRLPQRHLEILTLGALLHDVGKLAIPDPVLNKRSPLDGRERAMMRLHPLYSAALLLRAGAPQVIAAVAASHHERWDGTGYPLGLEGDEIPLDARIVALADTWDAMTGGRVYRGALTIERAAEMLWDERLSGQFQPGLLERFLHLVRGRMAESLS